MRNAGQEMRYASGHEAGANALQTLVESALVHRIPYLTVFVFSTENWQRDESEVAHLLALFNRVASDKKILKKLMKKGVRVAFIGDIEGLGSHLKRLPYNLRTLAAKTASNDQLVLTLALNYGGRWDITQAANRIAYAAKNGTLDSEKLSEAQFAGYLTTSDLPDPDLLIRTSNEIRISNFLLWQCAYTELYFTDVLWPDFTATDLAKAIAYYQSKQRRFGARSHP